MILKKTAPDRKVRVKTHYLPGAQSHRSESALIGLRPGLLHEPTVTDDDRLSGQRVRRGNKSTPSGGFMLRNERAFRRGLRLLPYHHLLAHRFVVEIFGQRLLFAA